MQFTEKRLRVKWYGGLSVACRVTPALKRRVGSTVLPGFPPGTTPYIRLMHRPGVLPEETSGSLSIAR